MDFRIKAVIIWPKSSENELRRIDFSLDKVNVITGGSEKGKSAIIAIIDYCLGSGTCRIPTRIIRDKSQWFGVLFQVGNTELLLARKEPGLEQISNDMYMKEGVKVALPSEPVANYNVEDVKKRLDNIAGLSDLRANPNEESRGFNSRPSFRDLTSFLFQPQYIIANQSTLFYRADSFAHREKLKNIFPYILKAVDNEYLELQEELKDINRNLNQLNNQLDNHNNYVTKWLGQLRGYYMQAKEFGLLKNEPYPSDKWTNKDYLRPLRNVQEEADNVVIPTLELSSVSTTSNRLSQLTSQEIDIAYSINQLKHRQELIVKIIESNNSYREDLMNQDNRLKAVNWFEQLLKKENKKCPFCGSHSTAAKEYVDTLIQKKADITDKETKLHDNYTVLSGEYKKVSSELEDHIKKLNNVRAEIEELKSTNTSDNSRLHTLNSIYQFAGKLNAEIENYDAVNSDNNIIGEIKKLEERKRVIESKINSSVIYTKTQRAKNKISDGIRFYADIFKAENRTEVIEFNEKDLTINFVRENGRKEALYEIGSGHNYMAYHISTLLSLHEFFISSKFHPVPNFLVLDQPTQVYFPESVDDENAMADDMDRVKRIFEALQRAIERTKYNLQIILLEHVGSDVWIGNKDIVKLKRWRIDEADNSLIPKDWQ